jgi:hypothetical protein
MNLFAQPALIYGVDRSHLARLLDEQKADLPPEAATLLSAQLTHEEFCAAWAVQFSSPGALGAPLRDALLAIETLALPENHHRLEAALTNLPAGYHVNTNASPLHQALHLWLIAQNTPGVTFPVGADYLPPINGDQKPPAPVPPSQTEAQIPKPRTIAPVSNLPTEPPTQSRDSSFPSFHHSNPTPSHHSTIPPFHHSSPPWPEPVDGAQLLADVSARYSLYLFLPPGAADAMALWTPHTHALEAFHLSPRLSFYSLEPGCGKTTTFDVLATMVRRPLRAESLSAAVLFRLVHQFQPTLLLDELDAYLPQSEELRGLLNAGHKRGAHAYRCEGERKAVRAFKAFAPAALAGLGLLPATLRDRSLLIPLLAAKPGQLIARFDPLNLEAETVLARKLARWASDNFSALAACNPPLPPGAFNRLADNWRPLLAVAQVAGGDWPDRALQAFAQLTSSPQPSTQRPQLSSNPQLTPQHSQLLSALHTVFTQSAADRLFSSQIVTALRALPGRPSRGDDHSQAALNETWLGRRLSSLGIRSQTLRIGSRRAKGYLRTQLLPLLASSPGLGAQTLMDGAGI